LIRKDSNQSFNPPSGLTHCSPLAPLGRTRSSKPMAFGHGSTVFFDDEDRQTYLKLLSGYAQKHHIQIWAYCLMSNHIHLLALPETETALSRGIGLTNQVYTQYLNCRLNQSGRIWQNRFFSCVVENDQYLLLLFFAG